MQQVSALASLRQAVERLAQRTRAIEGPLKLGGNREIARRFERDLRTIALEGGGGIKVTPHEGALLEDSLYAREAKLPRRLDVGGLLHQYSG